MSQPTRFEVQEYTVVDGWINNWTVEIPIHIDEWVTRPQTFATADEAQAAIYEFFADLTRAGMVQSYDMSDYRVVPIAYGAANK